MKTPTAMIAALAAVAIAILGSITLMVVTVEKSQLPEAWIAVILGILGTVITQLVQLGRTEQIRRDVSDLANGKMDSKIRAGTADVLRDELIDPDQADQIAADRKRRNGDV